MDFSKIPHSLNALTADQRITTISWCVSATRKSGVREAALIIYEIHNRDVEIKRRRKTGINLARQGIAGPRERSRDDARDAIADPLSLSSRREISTSCSRGFRSESFQDPVLYPVPRVERAGSGRPHRQLKHQFNLIPNGDVSSRLSLGSLDLPASSEMCRRSIGCVDERLYRIQPRAADIVENNG